MQNNFKVLLVLIFALVAANSLAAEDLMKDKYFSRTATWNWLKDSLVVHDSFSPLAPRMITMKQWHELVFMAADGMHTIDEFVAHMASQYEGVEPPGLREQIYELIQMLEKDYVLEVHDKPKALPVYFAEEYKPEDAEIKKKLMQQDGLID